MKGRFVQVQLLASLAAALGRYRDSFTVSLVDLLLEAIRAGLEQPSAWDAYQQRVAAARLFAELYAWQVVKSTHLFYLLYLLIQFGAR